MSGTCRPAVGVEEFAADSTPHWRYEMNDEKEPDAADAAIDDLEVTDQDADRVRGGDAVPVLSTVLKTQNDTAKSTISNIR